MKLLWVAAAVVAAAACSGDKARPPQVTSPLPDAGAADGGGSGGTGGNSASGGSDAGGSPADSGGDGSVLDGAADAAKDAYPPPVDPQCSTFPKGPCGDGILNCGEACDGEAFYMDTCQGYGFDSGTLKCTAACKVDFSGCKGTESCTDGVDNDGNGLVDCGDRAGCGSQCRDSCGSVALLTDPGDASGPTGGRSDSRDPSCSVPSGPEVVYSVVASIDGTMVATLTTSAYLGLSLRTTCEDVASELACGLGPQSVNVTAGQQVFVVVESFDPHVNGTFQLHVETVP